MHTTIINQYIEFNIGMRTILKDTILFYWIKNGKIIKGTKDKFNSLLKKNQLIINSYLCYNYIKCRIA